MRSAGDSGVVAGEDEQLQGRRDGAVIGVARDAVLVEGDDLRDADGEQE